MNAPDVITPLMRPFLPATADFGSGKDSPRQFLERCIVELDTWEPKIGAFVTLNLDAARAAADRSTERWRTGKSLSPIDGMPIGIKDIIETIDMPTENGSPLLLIHRIDGPQIGPILAVCGDVRLDIIKPTASGGLPLATDAHPWKIELLAFHSRAPLSLARVKSSQARSFANE